LALTGLVAGCAAPPVGGPPPHLDKVVLRETVQRYDMIYPTFYFHAPEGDVIEVHREIVAASTEHPNFNPVSRINIDPMQQRQGAVWVGGWGCGPNASTTTIRAYLLDARGNHSNTVDYTVVCKSAVELFDGKGGAGGPKGAGLD
jgi:hypothetical protein